MILPNLEISITLALHWTERVKLLSRKAARAVHAEENEYRFYCSATSTLFDLYLHMTDSITGARYVDKREGIAGELAWPVECMIQRLQEIREKAAGGRLVEVNQMLYRLDQISGLFLPLAVPVGEIPLGIQRKATFAKPHTGFFKLTHPIMILIHLTIKTLFK